MEEKAKQDAKLQAIEGIQQVLDFWEVAELWKSLAKAGTKLAFCQRASRKGFKLDAEDLDELVTLLNQFGMILQALEPLEDADK